MEQKIVKMAVKGVEDGQARMVLNFNQEDGRAFFVRFYVDELEKDFVETTQMLCRRDQSLTVTQRDGTYIVKDKGMVAPGTTWTAWDMLMHKCWAQANEIRKDNETGEKFYPIRMADHFIEPCARRLAG